MKIRILIIITVFCGLLFCLMMKTSPQKDRMYHSGVDSALLYASYDKVDIINYDNPPSFLTSFLQKKDSMLLGYHCNTSDTTGIYKFYQSLPTMMMKMLDQKLIGIYFYENLSADGYLHQVYSKKEQYYVIVCNKNILNRSLSEYFSEKENSRFVPSAYHITVNVSDSVLNALFYVLLHEFFHIFDYENKISTPFDISGNYSGVKSPFISNYWLNPTVPQGSFFNHHYLIGDLYNKVENRLIDSCYVVPIYAELSKGYFASYYSTVSFQEDLAEYLALYYMTQFFDSKYEIEVRKGNELLLCFSPFENRQLVERFYDFPKKIQLSLKY